MSSRILYCRACDTYTISQTCRKCGGASVMPHPPRFSPEDRYGKYRRKLMAMRETEE